MTTETRIHYVGQLQRPNERPENVELFLDERPNAPAVKYKTVNTQRTSDVTLTNDPHLVGWALQSASFYRMTAYLKADAADATPDIKFTFQFSNAPVTSSYRFHAILSSGVVGTMDVLEMSSTGVIELASADRGITFQGFVDTHETLDSVVNFQWAQNVSDVGDTQLFAGSWIKIERMGVS